jgi:hypothetical protein
MSTFGPFYPPALQASVNHAERLARVLDWEEASRSGDLGDGWVVGRGGEIDRVVEMIVLDWRGGRVTSEQAAAAVDDYLAGLHDGLAVRFGVTRPSCCTGGSAITEIGPKGEAETALYDSIERLLMNLGASNPS